MQASWGMENGRQSPTRAGELYGEVGTWMQSTIESVPWYPSAKEKRAAKNIRKWDGGKSTPGSPTMQAQSTKRPAEMDVAPQGVKSTLGSKPGVMTMADHDHGEVWPPLKGHETDLPFMAMVKERKPDYNKEVNGIMVGYSGHVPRARDKVGTNPLGNVPGRPGAPSLSRDAGLAQTSKSVSGSGFSDPSSEHPLYVSEARDPQLKTSFVPGRRIHAASDPNDTYKGGVPPGYAGHVHGARYSVGQSVYSTADTYGHPDSQGATAKEFSSHNDARGATYDELASIYGNNFVADGIADDPMDSFVKRGEVADWVKTDEIVGGGKFGTYGSGAGAVA